MPLAVVRCILGHNRNTKSHSLNMFAKVMFISVLTGSQIAIESNDLGLKIYFSRTNHCPSPVAALRQKQPFTKDQILAPE